MMKLYKKKDRYIYFCGLKNNNIHLNGNVTYLLQSVLARNQTGPRAHRTLISSKKKTRAKSTQTSWKHEIKSN